MPDGAIAEARRRFHRRLIQTHVLALRAGAVTNADTSSAGSRAIASRISTDMCSALRIKTLNSPGLTGQEQGRIFGDLTREFLEAALPAIPGIPHELAHVTGGSIAHYAQYAHLRRVEAVIRDYPELQVSLGGDYIIAPDVVVSRLPLEDEALVMRFRRKEVMRSLATHS